MNSRVILLLCLFIALFQVAISPAKAQSARFSTPVNGSVNVSINPTIRIYTQAKIDSAGIAFGGYQIDSLQKAILVIPKYVYDSIPHFMYDSTTSSYIDIWNKLGVRGAYSNPNDTTLEFVPPTLKMGQTYVAIIHNVFVVSGTSTVQVYDTITTVFTTVLPPHSIVSNSLVHLGTQQFKTNDTIKIRFSRKLDSANTPAGPLAELYLMARNPADTIIDTLSSIPPFIQDPVNYFAWVGGADSSYLYITSNELATGSTFELSLLPSRLTGDSTQDVAFRTKIKERLHLSIESRSYVVSDTLPDFSHEDFMMGDYYLRHGDTIHLAPPRTYEGFTFLRWECPDDGVINFSTAIPLQVTKDSLHLTDLRVTALYIRSLVDTLTTKSDSNGVAKVRSVYFTTLSGTAAGSGVLNYVGNRGDSIFLYPEPDSGYAFHHWYSTDAGINGSTKAVLKVVLNGDLIVTPVFYPAAPDLLYRLCGAIDFIDLPTGVSPSAVAILTTPTCYTDALPASHNVTLSILNSNYGLRQYTVQKNGVITSRIPDPALFVQSLAPTQTYTVNETSTRPRTIVKYFVERLETQLQVEIAMEDGSAPELDYIAPIGSHITRRFGVVVDSRERLGIRDIHFSAWSVISPRDQWNLTYHAGEVVELTPSVGEFAGYEFVGWSTASGYIYSPTSGTAQKLLVDLDYSPLPIKVRAIFRKKFRLESIAIIQDEDFNGTFAEYAYDPDPKIGNWGALQQELKAVVETPGSNDYVTFKLVFNHPVDRNTVKQGIRAWDCWENVTDGKFYLYDYFSSSSVTSGDGKTLTFKIKNPSAYAAKLQMISLAVSNRLKSTSGSSLSNSGQWDALTINPDVEWHVQKAHVHHGNEFCLFCNSGAEIYFHSTVAYYRSDFSEDCPGGFTLAEAGETSLEVPCGQEKWMGDGEDVQDFNGTRYFNYLIFGKQRISNGSSFLVAKNVMDQDQTVFWNWVIGIAGAILLFTTPITMLLGGTFGWWAALAYSEKAAEFIAMILAAEGVFNGSDDSFGSHGWYGNRENTWGAHPSYKNELTHKFSDDGGDVDVTLEAKLK